MNLIAFMLLGSSVLAALRSKEEIYALKTVLESRNNQNFKIKSAQAAQPINCKAAKEIIILADLSGVGDSGWARYVIPSVQKLVYSFNISDGATRIQIYSRFSTLTYYWCINLQLFSTASSNMSELLPIIQTMPLSYILTPMPLWIIKNDLIGRRRSNIPVEILFLTDWQHYASGVQLFEADKIKSIGGVRFLCVGVGGAVDYGYLGLLCDNIYKISNYAGILNSINQISSMLCSGQNVPTVRFTTFQPSLAPNEKVTVPPTIKSPTFIPGIRPTQLITSYPTVKSKRPTNYPTRVKPTNYPTVST